MEEKTRLTAVPKKRLCVLTCMDTRIDPYELLALERGDAHILRNAGGLATDDALRSLILSQNLLETREVAIIMHTECGVSTLDEDQLRKDLSARTGVDDPRSFHSFRDLTATVREQVRRVRAHPWLDLAESVRGFIYDVESESLTEVDG